MDATIIQYIGIAVLFCVALVYVYRRTKQSLKGEKTCSKGCDCPANEKNNAFLKANTSPNKT